MTPDVEHDTTQERAGAHPADVPQAPDQAGPPSTGQPRGPGHEPGPGRGRGVSRRSFFTTAASGLAVGGVVGAGAGVGADRAWRPDSSPDSHPASASSTAHEFYTGTHQAGIATVPQQHSVFMAFDLTTTTPQGLQVLLARWSAGIAQLMAGKPVGQVDPPGRGEVAGDTGEGLDLGPFGLTVTIGLGPGVFDSRFGLAARRPALLSALPALPSDQLDPQFTGGDISLQACADHPQVAYHAIRNLARMARDSVATRWTVMGFGRASAQGNQSTPRNLLGFKDGTRNVTTPQEYAQHVWVRGSDQPWMDGGTYQVARKIRMNIEVWDSDQVADQESVIGRHKASGAPLSGTREFDTPDFDAASAGSPVIDAHAHIRLASAENNGGKKILRRGYNYTDGINPFGQLDAGLLFIAYMNDPATFVALQRRLGSLDSLNEYIAHVGSGLFAVPPAPRRGAYIGQSLFT